MEGLFQLMRHYSARPDVGSMIEAIIQSTYNLLHAVRVTLYLVDEHAQVWVNCTRRWGDVRCTDHPSTNIVALSLWHCRSW